MGGLMAYTDWEAAMRRYMHRGDIEADLPQVWIYAQTQFHNAWLRKDTESLFADRDKLAEKAPRALHHAGLMYLHEMAQDDESLAREAQLFSKAMAEFIHHWSVNNFTPDPAAQGGQ